MQFGGVELQQDVQPAEDQDGNDDGKVTGEVTELEQTQEVLGWGWGWGRRRAASVDSFTGSKWQELFKAPSTRRRVQFVIVWTLGC